MIFKSNNIKSSIDQYIQLFFSFFTFYFLFTIIKKDLFLSIYIKIATIISSIAIIQEVGYLLNISFLWDYSDYFGIPEKKSFALNLLRVTAFFSEPAHLGFFLLIPIYLIYKDKKIIKHFPIPIAFILTFSFGNYLMLFLFLFLASLFIKREKISIRTLFIIILMIIFPLIISSIPEVNQKFNSLFITNENMRDPENGSMFAIYSLMMANLDAWGNNLIFGAGFGNKIDIYDNYMYTQFGVIMSENAFYPDELFLAKFFGETGFVGLFLFIMMIKTKWRNSTIEAKIFLLAFFIVTLKSGSYYNPMLFLLLGYYLTPSSLYEKI
ncbi:hypothetical protein RZ760_020925 [Providencia rettgeri]|nr:hypothetical protein [Providencia rettgeri]